MLTSIALSGGMGSGKSTAAAYLQDRYDYNAVKISQPIYEIAQMLWGEGSNKNRALLQDIGKKMKEIDSDVWLNYYINVSIGEGCAGTGPFVNDTTRFPNEYWVLKKAGFAMVRVEAPEDVRIDRLQKIDRIQDLDRINDISETALFGAEQEAAGIQFDFELMNDEDDPASLYDQIDRMVGQIEAGY